MEDSLENYWRCGAPAAAEHFQVDEEFLFGPGKGLQSRSETIVKPLNISRDFDMLSVL